MANPSFVEEASQQVQPWTPAADDGATADLAALRLVHDGKYCSSGRSALLISVIEINYLTLDFNYRNYLLQNEYACNLCKCHRFASCATQCGLDFDDVRNLIKILSCWHPTAM